MTLASHLKHGEGPVNFLFSKRGSLGLRPGLRDATAGGEGFLEGGLVLVGAVVCRLDRKGREQGRREVLRTKLSLVLKMGRIGEWTWVQNLAPCSLTK